MAKKSARTTASTTTAAAAKRRLNERDTKTLGDLQGLAGSVVEAARKKREPHIDVPTRSLSNVKYNKSKRFIEMGSNTNRRQLFNLSQAKSYMQTLMVASGSKRLIEEGKTTSLRGLFYMLLHTIEGTKEKTFDDQSESDTIIEDLEVTVNALREELHLYAKNAGSMVGSDRPQRQRRRDRLLAHGLRRLQHSQHRRAGRGAVHEIEGQVHPARRKGHGLAAVQRGQVLAEARLHPHPRRRPASARRAADAAPLHNELKLPVYCLFDNDPWGYYIYSVIKQGSINLAHESERMAVPDAKYLGLRSIDFDALRTVRRREDQLERHRREASQADRRDYPWFKDKKPCGRRKSS